MPNVNAMLSVIRGAIRNRQSLYFTANDEPREFCPHVLGTKRGEWHVFGWQFGGGSSRGLPPGGDWRCIELEDISTEIVARSGPWHRGWTKGQRDQTCVDDVDTVIDSAYAAEIRNTSP